MAPAPTPTPTVLAIDQGTTGTTALLVALDGTVLRRSYRDVAVRYPRPGWVEQDAEAIWVSVVEACAELLDGAAGPAPVCIGLTNQRETTVVFEREGLRPLGPAIVWQDRRTASICDAHRAAGEEPELRRRTGLLLDPYFSATKLELLLREDEDLRRRAQAGALCASTVDGWLVARLSGGARCAVDASNASRTLLYDLARGDFDPELCSLFGVPEALLPEVVPSSGECAVTDPSAFLGLRIPITGIAGDQQAALFGQACITRGMAKNTYGTGSFVLVNAGTRALPPPDGLLTTVAWRLGSADSFALEGSIFTTGAAITWLRDVGLIASPSEVGPLVDSIADANGVHFIPALAGLGAPYWDPAARGAFVGLSAGVTRAHLVRAVVESMALRTRDVVEAMEAGSSGVRLDELRVDGGVSVVDGLCQFQADMLGIPVARSTSAEATAIGAAWLAAVGAGLVDGPEAVAAAWRPGRRFEPAAPGMKPEEPYRAWLDAVARVR